MSDFTVPTCTQSTGNVAGNETISEVIAEQPAPTGGTFQSTRNSGPLDFKTRTVAHYPWLFINHSLPYKRTPETSWVRTNGDISVLFTAPQKFNAHGNLESGLIPYGRIGREVLMWLVSSALEAGERTIEISRTWRGFLRALDIPYSAANRAMVQTQLRAILDLSITIHHPGTLAGRNLSTEKFMIGSGEDLYFDQDGLLDDAYRSVVILSNEFFDRISAEASPVEGSMKILIENWREVTHKHPRSPMVSDAYLWLAGRMPRLHGDGTYLPWSALASQFGAETAELDFRKNFRTALRTAAGEYFTPLGPKFDMHTYIREVGAGSRRGVSGIHLTPVTPEHRKLLGWGARRATTKPAQAPAKKHTPTNHQNPKLTETSTSITPQTTRPKIVTFPTHEGVDIGELRTHLDNNGVNTTAVSNGALRSAIDTVLSRATSVGNAQALVSSAITREPALLGITAPAQKAVAPSAPIVKCPVHTMDITGKVCSGCAAELKATSTTATEAQICWDSIKSHLNYLADTYGVDTSAEKAKYSSFATARGASVKH